MACSKSTNKKSPASAATQARESKQNAARHVPPLLYSGGAEKERGFIMATKKDTVSTVLTSEQRDAEAGTFASGNARNACFSEQVQHAFAVAAHI
jgi:hypothetical protein